MVRGFPQLRLGRGAGVLTTSQQSGSQVSAFHPQPPLPAFCTLSSTQVAPSTGYRGVRGKARPGPCGQANPLWSPAGLGQPLDTLEVWGVSLGATLPPSSQSPSHLPLLSSLRNHHRGPPGGVRGSQASLSLSSTSAQE